MEKIIYVDKPLDEYNSYREKNNQKTDEYFEELTRISKIDVEQNRAQTKKINNLASKLNQAKNRHKKIKLGSIINLVLFILAFIVGAISIWLGVEFSKTKLNVATISIATVSCAVGLTLFIIHFAVILKNLKNASKHWQNLQQQLNEETEIGLEQTAPLRNLFTHGMKVKLFRETMPFIKLEQFFKNEQLAKMRQEYGLGELSDLESTVEYVQSGEIYGNPFLFARVLNHEMSEKTYTGTLTIRWTERSTDFNGNSKLVTKTEVLHASVTKPYPLYTYNTKFIWGSQSAPDLTFSRDYAHIERKNDSEIKKLVKATEKTLKKQEEININFTSLPNTEFEAFFNALDRNDQTQFRLLFTPLAQQNITKLLRDKTVGYGDDFSYIKHHKINIIEPEHLYNASLLDDLSVYYSYSYDTIKDTFNAQMQDYFKHIYFTFAPMLSIPIFQQTKSLDFIYNDWIKGNLNQYEHEHQLSYLPRNLFTHNLVKTNSILKTHYMHSEDEQDTVKVSSFGYDIKPQVEYVSVYGGDGHYHNVPVKWDEYIRYDNDVIANITKINSDPTERSAYNDEINQKVKQSENNNHKPIFSAKSIINIL
ncbi:hypothetical protein EG856_03515 [Mycoplasmopsis phocirhinis]|uniref:Uncharacterized protein n=1 Tax=Mycoplasmopsis phocirhinis TaxID=142650 RepID=A0A4P6MQE9_9BACT|nr:hypothetical protein [Mycoplasmopsis phocirhinis]QBF34956.1 hypothetical protein EG856_03515 [Mycoplasmopsis phocirhinis]